MCEDLSGRSASPVQRSEPRRRQMMNALLKKMIGTVLHHLPSPGEKSALVLGGNTTAPTAATTTNSPSTGNSDPHMLANIYLDKYGRENGHLTLRFYHGQFWR